MQRAPVTYETAAPVEHEHESCKTKREALGAKLVVALQRPEAEGL